MKIILTISLVCILIITGLAQSTNVGKSITNIEISDSKGLPKKLAFLGQKTVVVFYLDPDESTVLEPLTEAINSKNFPKEKLEQIIIINAKDTWIPNLAIRTGLQKNEKKYPMYSYLIDNNKSLANSWGLSNCNGTCVFVLIGQDSKIKLVHNITSKQGAKTISIQALKAIETDISK